MKNTTVTITENIADAANEAVFWYQLPSAKAVRFITKNVKGATTEQAVAAVKATVVQYKAKSTA